MPIQNHMINILHDSLTKHNENRQVDEFNDIEKAQNRIFNGYANSEVNILTRLKTLS